MSTRWTKPVVKRTRRLLADLAAECADVGACECGALTPDQVAFLEGAARDAMDILRATEERAPKPMKLERRKLEFVKKWNGFDEWAALREAVFTRANGRCEACNRFFGNGLLQVDHWEGGGGRRQASQGVETCWALCAGCHRERTLNSPSAAHWNLIRQSFCSRLGYPFKPHKELLNARNP